MDPIAEGFSRIVRKIVVILRSENCMHYSETRVIFTTLHLNFQKRISASGFLLENKNKCFFIRCSRNKCFQNKKNAQEINVSSGNNAGFKKKTCIVLK